jgi:hypothetical protein
MRREIVVLGFFLIVLILAAGCSSPQIGSSTGPKSQGSAAENTNTAVIIQCSQLPVDPIRFQKFLPTIPGYTPYFGPKISEGTNYINFTKKTGYSFVNFIGDFYQISNSTRVEVIFEDLGPCSGDFALDQLYIGTGSYGLGREYMSGTEKDKYASKINFHGYPASRAMRNINGVTQGIVRIGVNNRLFVTITAIGRDYSFSQADADIEKFANAIDFRGFAASV